MRRTTRTLAASVFAAAVAVGATVSTAGVARADDTPPTSLELLDKCEEADYCEFHANGGPELYVGDSHQIGTTLYNCGPGAATKQVTWIDTTGETNSVGVSLIVATEASDPTGWIGVFKTEFEITYGHKWGTTESTYRTTEVKVKEGEKGWLVRSTPMQRIAGTYELHFGDRFRGHYFWYVPFTQEGPAPDANDIDVVSQRSAPMTDEEKRQCA